LRLFGGGKGKSDGEEDGLSDEELVNAELQGGGDEEPGYVVFPSPTVDSTVLMEDEKVLEIVEGDDDLRDLIPILSRLNRTTRISRDEYELLSLEVDLIFEMKMAAMNEDKFEMKHWAKLQALRFYIQMALRDAVDGWRGRLITERHRRISIRREEPEVKRSRWRWF